MLHTDAYLKLEKFSRKFNCNIRQDYLNQIENRSEAALFKRFTFECTKCSISTKIVSTQ